MSQQQKQPNSFYIKEFGNAHAYVVEYVDEQLNVYQAANFYYDYPGVNKEMVAQAAQDFVNRMNVLSVPGPQTSKIRYS